MSLIESLQYSVWVSLKFVEQETVKNMSLSDDENDRPATQGQLRELSNLVIAEFQQGLQNLNQRIDWTYRVAIRP